MDFFSRNTQKSLELQTRLDQNSGSIFTPHCPGGERASLDSLIAQKFGFPLIRSAWFIPEPVMAANRMSDSRCLTPGLLPVSETIAVTRGWDSSDRAYRGPPKARALLPLRFCGSPTVGGRYGGDVRRGGNQQFHSIRIITYQGS